MGIVCIAPGWEVTWIVFFLTLRLRETKHSLLHLEEMIILGSVASIWLKYTVCLFSLTRAGAACGNSSHIKIIAGVATADKS